MAEQTHVTKVRAADHKLWQGGSRPLLGRLDIELTERCDNDCVHCCICLPQHDEAARAREMTAGQVIEVLRQAADLGTLSVRFTGGEPLVREDFEELYVAARRMGIKVMLFTNARGITPQLADLFARMPPLERIEVSVYGMRAETYDAVARRRGAYAEFRRGVALLEERHVPFILKSVLLPQNRADMAEFEAWCTENPWMDHGPGYAMFYELRSRRPDRDHRNEQIRALRVAPRDGLAIIARDRERYVAHMRDFCSRFMGPPGAALFPCGAGHGTCVDAYGVAQMCLPLRHPETVCDLHQPSSGDIRAGALREAVAEVFPRLRTMQATNPEYLRRCARCFLKGLCEQCPARSWSEHGALDTPVEYLCDVAHVQARDLHLLDAEEHGWEVAEWRSRLELIR